jgi:DNA-binding response OmpR family regulator
VTFSAAAVLRALTVVLALTIAAVVGRRRGQPGAMPFIFLSGDTLGVETRRFLEQTGVPILEKPFDAAAVRRVVESVLRRP